MVVSQSHSAAGSGEPQGRQRSTYCSGISCRSASADCLRQALDNRLQGCSEMDALQQQFLSMLPRPRLGVRRSNRSNAVSLNLAIEAPPSLDIVRFGSLKLCSVGQNCHAHHSSLMKLGGWSACFPSTDSEDNSIRAASSRLQSVHHGAVKMEPGGPVCN